MLCRVQRLVPYSVAFSRTLFSSVHSVAAPALCTSNRSPFVSSTSTFRRWTSTQAATATLRVPNDAQTLGLLRGIDGSTIVNLEEECKCKIIIDAAPAEAPSCTVTFEAESAELADAAKNRILRLVSGQEPDRQTPEFRRRFEIRQKRLAEEKAAAAELEQKRLAEAKPVDRATELKEKWGLLREPEKFFDYNGTEVPFVRDISEELASKTPRELAESGAFDNEEVAMQMRKYELWLRNLRRTAIRMKKGKMKKKHRVLLRKRVDERNKLYEIHYWINRKPGDVAYQGYC